MQFALNQDQTLLAQTARDFITENSPVARMRALRDSGEALGYSRTMWAQMAEMGWTGLPFAESDGGLGLGMAEAILVTEALGRTLCPEPLLTSTLAACQALALGGTEAQRQTWLGPAIEAGKVLALAYQEPGMRFDPRSIRCQAESQGTGFLLTGEKSFVLGGVEADAYIVVARTQGQAPASEGLSLFVVPATSAGLQVQRRTLVDSRNCAHLQLQGVQVAESQLVGQLHGGSALLDDVLDRATVALCGEMLGGMQVALDMTLDYLRERKQFDVTIGSFQSLQHRAARMYIEVELVRSAVMAAARGLDSGSAEAKLLVSNAKARCSDAGVLIANEAVQMHGGIGMTDEHDIGFYMKRARAAELTYGDAAFHRDRFATLSGY